MASPQLRPVATEIPAQYPLPRVPERAQLRWLTGATLVASDLLALALAGSISVLVWYVAERKLEPGFYLSVCPLLGVFLIAYATAGLYPGAALNPVDFKVRRGALAKGRQMPIILGFDVSGVVRGMGKAVSGLIVCTLSPAMLKLMVSRTATLALEQLMASRNEPAPLLRSCTRSYFSGRSWWGHPVVIFGAESAAEAVVEALQRQPEAGLKPFAVFIDGTSAVRSIRGVPIFRKVSDAPKLVLQCHVQCAILAISEMPQSELLQLRQRCSG